MSGRDESFDSWYQSRPDYFSGPSDGLVKALREYCVRPCSALDLGCGQGRNALWLASEGFDVDAIDISEAAINDVRRVANSRGLHINARVADAANCNLGENQYGLIVAQTTLNHLEPQVIPKCCASISKALQVGGFLYCVVFTTQDPGFTSAEDMKSECADFVKYYFSPGELKARFQDIAILSYQEYMKKDNSHGPTHLHGKAKIIGHK